jgi:hypothetical protein
VKGVLLIASLLVTASLGAEEKIKYPSPDGKLALRVAYPKTESANVESGIIDLGTHSVVLDLHGPGRPYIDDAKLVWSADSQRVAFFEPSRRGGRTRVFFRSGNSFDEVELPTLPEPKTAKKVPPYANDKTIEVLQEPVRWLKSGALIIYSEVEGDYSGRGALEIIVAFDQNHKPSVVKSKKVSPRPIGANSAKPRAEVVAGILLSIKERR